MNIEKKHFIQLYQHLFILFAIIFLFDFIILEIFSYDPNYIALSRRNSIVSLIVIISTFSLIYLKWGYGFVFRLMIICATILILAAKASIMNSFSIYTNSTSSSLTFVIYVSLAILAVISVILYTLNTIIYPIEEMIRITDQLSSRDFVKHQEIRDIKLNDELGHLYRGILTMRENLVSDFNTLIQTIHNTSGLISNISTEVASSSEELTALTEEISANIQQISQSSTHQSVNATQGIQNMQTMSIFVDTALNEIKETLGIINDIAGQTNVLALNAAIEAARAGEYGRGFAVVSDNVRRMAEETKHRAEDINKNVEKMINDINGAISTISDTFQGFASQSEELAASSEEVASSTEQQSSSMSQVTSTSQELAYLGESLESLIKNFTIKPFTQEN